MLSSFEIEGIGTVVIDKTLNCNFSISAGEFFNRFSLQAQNLSPKAVALIQDAIDARKTPNVKKLAEEVTAFFRKVHATVTIFRESKMREALERGDHLLRRKKATELARFTGETPEALLQNINALHPLVIHYIKAEELKFAADLLEGEVSQYKEVIEKFRLLGLGEFQADIQHQLQEVSELYFRIRESILLEQYQQEHRKLEAFRRDEKYHQVSYVLGRMQEVLTLILKYAVDLGKPEVKEKYAARLDEIQSNIEFNDQFIRFKEFEDKFNRAATTLNQAKYTETLTHYRAFFPELDAFVDQLAELTGENSNLQPLLEESRALRKLATNMEGRVKAAFGELVKGGVQGTPDAGALVERFQPQIAAPSLLHIETTDDIRAFIASLDREFQTWEHKRDEKV